ncbi:hypothetical protein PIB30_047391 [Stylosanthes scabra]|uniref:Transmembrane protein n=1 Tax=Stylosanthes scabra TaxID=79078 RepID=A0ABU6QG39_9FABA|nr:hypothetical protein [Stylosanthes scabra]
MPTRPKVSDHLFFDSELGEDPCLVMTLFKIIFVVPFFIVPLSTAALLLKRISHESCSSSIKRRCCCAVNRHVKLRLELQLVVEMKTKLARHDEDSLSGLVQNNGRKIGEDSRCLLARSSDFSEKFAIMAFCRVHVQQQFLYWSRTHSMPPRLLEGVNPFPA